MNSIAKLLHRKKARLLKKESNKGKEADDKCEMQFDRCITVASILTQLGFYAFDSNQSWDVFKAASLEFTYLNDEGVGVPSLFIISKPDMVGKYSGNSPSFLIYKFIVKNIKEPGPIGEYEKLAQKNSFCLYKVPYGEVYQRRDVGMVEYRFLFPEAERGPKTFTMTRIGSSRDLHTYIEGRALCWCVGTSFLVDRDDYKLQSLDETYPEIPNGDEKGRGGERMPVKRPPSMKVVAYYTRANMETAFRKMFKQAEIYIGNRDSDIILPVNPRITEIITCQGLLVQYLEYQRREKRVDERTGRYNSYGTYNLG